MQDKKLSRLNRKQLLELLLEQTKETERLQAELDEAKLQLQDRNLKIQEAGNLADAVISINQVMEIAQKAAQQYLDNMAAMEAETEEKCKKMLEQAAMESEKIRKKRKR